MLDVLEPPVLYAIVGVVVLAVASLLGLVVFASKEETFEDVVAKQRKAQEALLSSLQGGNAKSGKQNRKYKQKNKSQNKKASKKVLPEEIEIDSGVDDDEVSADLVNVSAPPPTVVVKEPPPPATGKKGKKGKKAKAAAAAAEKLKLEKQEKTIVVVEEPIASEPEKVEVEEPSAVEEEEIIIESVAEAEDVEAAPEAEVSIEEEIEIPVEEVEVEAPVDVGELEAALTEQEVEIVTESESQHEDEEIDEEPEIEDLPAPVEEPAPVPIEAVPIPASEPAPAPVSKEKSKSSKKKSPQKYEGVIASVEKLEADIASSQLNASEIQQVIDSLLAKQNELEQWQKPNQKSDPVEQLKRRIAELETIFTEERSTSQSMAAKNKELRLELQHERNQRQSIQTEAANRIGQQIKEAETMRKRMEEKHVSEMQSAQAQIQRMQVLIDDGANHHKEVQRMKEEINHLKNASMMAQQLAEDKQSLMNELAQLQQGNKQVRQEYDNAILHKQQTDLHYEQELQNVKMAKADSENALSMRLQEVNDQLMKVEAENRNLSKLIELAEQSKVEIETLQESAPAEVKLEESELSLEATCEKLEVELVEKSEVEVEAMPDSASNEEVEQLKSKLAEVEAKLLETEMALAAKEAKELEVEIVEKSEVEVEALQDSESNSEVEVEALQDSESNSEVEQLKLKLVEIEAKLVETELSLASKSKELEVELAEKSEVEVEAVQETTPDTDELDQLKSEMLEIQAKLEESELALTAKSKELEEYTVKLSEAAGQSDSVDGDILDLKAQITHKDQLILEMEQKLADAAASQGSISTDIVVVSKGDFLESEPLETKESKDFSESFEEVNADKEFQDDLITKDSMSMDDLNKEQLVQLETLDAKLNENLKQMELLESEVEERKTIEKSLRDEYNKMKEESQKYQDELDEAKRLLAEKTVEIYEKESIIAEKEAAMSEKIIAVEENLTMATPAEDTESDLNKLISEKDAVIIDLKGKITDLEGENNELKDISAKADQSGSDELMEKLKLLEEKLQEKTDSEDSLREITDQLKEKNNMSDEEVAKCQEENMHLKNVLTETESMLSRLQAGVDAEVQKWQMKVEEKNSELVESKKNNEDLKQVLFKHGYDHENLTMLELTLGDGQKQLMAEKEENIKLKVELKEFENNLLEAQKQLTQKSEEKEKFENDLLEAQKQLTQKTEEKEKKADHHVVDVELVDVNNKLKKTISERDLLIREYKNMKDNSTKMETDLQTVKAELATKAEDLDARMKEIGHLKKCRHSCDTISNNKPKDTTSKDKDILIGKLTKQVEELKEELREERDCVIVDIDPVNAENLHKQVEELSTELESEKKCNVNLVTKLQDIEKSFQEETSDAEKILILESKLKSAEVRITEFELEKEKVDKGSRNKGGAGDPSIGTSV